MTSYLRKHCGNTGFIIRHFNTLSYQRSSTALKQGGSIDWESVVAPAVTEILGLKKLEHFTYFNVGEKNLHNMIVSTGHGLSKNLEVRRLQRRWLVVQEVEQPSVHFPT